MRPRAKTRPAPTPVASAKGRQKLPPLEGASRLLRLRCAPPMRVADGTALASSGGASAVGAPRVVVACEDALVVLDGDGKVYARAEAEGWPQVLAVVDLGRGAEIVAGFGVSRKRRDVPARLLRFHLQRRKLVSSPLYAPTTSRNEITQLIVERSGPRWALIVTHYASKYQVRHVRLEGRGVRVKQRELGTWLMATTHARVQLGERRLSVIGQIYGDDKGAEGGAFALTGAKPQKVPTVRGVRALAAVDLNRKSARSAQGTEELLIADGWARNYGRDGRALLGVAHYANGRFDRRPFFAFAGDFSIERVVPVDVDHDDEAEVLVVASSTTRLLRRRRASGKWRAHVLAYGATDAAAIDLDGDGLDEIVAVGARSSIVSLAPLRQAKAGKR